MHQCVNRMNSWQWGLIWKSKRGLCRRWPKSVTNKHLMGNLVGPLHHTKAASQREEWHMEIQTQRHRNFKKRKELIQVVVWSAVRLGDCRAAWLHGNLRVESEPEEVRGGRNERTYCKWRFLCLHNRCVCINSFVSEAKQTHKHKWTNARTCPHTQKLAVGVQLFYKPDSGLTES